MESLPAKFTGNTLLKNTDFSHLTLKKELKKLNLFTARQLADINDEIVIWDSESRTVAYSNNKKALEVESTCDHKTRTVDGITTTVISLFSAQRVTHDYSRNRSTIHHVEVSKMCDNGVKFYATKNADEDAFLVVNSLWLAVPGFQKLLNNNLDKHNICDNLSWDSKRQYFVPQKKRHGLFNYSRNAISSGDNALTWNDSTHSWDTSS